MRAGNLPYDWIGESARQAAPLGPSRQRLVVEGVLLVAAVFFLAYVLWVAQYGANDRWILGSLVIAFVAGYAWFALARRTSEPAPLVAPTGGSLPQTGELTSLGAAVRRANAGLLYSQVSVASRARAAFAERTALARGLSTDDMRRLERDPAGLKRALHDSVLEDFLYLPSWDQDERYRWVRETRDHGGFESALRRVLERMEAWR